VAEYLARYQAALNAVDSGSSVEISRCLGALKGCSRGYMESSSNYEQAFLGEMWRTEEMLRMLYGE